MLERAFRSVSFDGTRPYQLVWLYRGDHGPSFNYEIATINTDIGSRLSRSGEASDQFGTLITALDRYFLSHSGLAGRVKAVSKLNILLPTGTKNGNCSAQVNAANSSCKRSCFTVPLRHASKAKTPHFSMTIRNGQGRPQSMPTNRGFP